MNCLRRALPARRTSRLLPLRISLPRPRSRNGPAPAIFAVRSSRAQPASVPSPTGRGSGGTPSTSNVSCTSGGAEGHLALPACRLGMYLPCACTCLYLPHADARLAMDCSAPHLSPTVPYLVLLFRIVSQMPRTFTYRVRIHASSVPSSSLPLFLFPNVAPLTLHLLLCSPPPTLLSLFTISSQSALLYQAAPGRSANARPKRWCQSPAPRTARATSPES